MADFTQMLGALNSQPVLEGLTIAAKAQMMQNQDQKMASIISDFNEKSKTLDNDLTTTSQKLTNLANNPTIKEGTDALTNQAADFQATVADYYDRMNKVNQLYSGTQLQLAGIDREEAKQMANTLEIDKRTKMDIYERKAELPLKALQYEKATLDINTAKFNLDELKANKQVLDSVAKISSDQTFLNLTKRLAFNTNTGKYTYDEAKIRKEMFNVYGDDPNFGRAWLIIKDAIHKNTDKYTPPVFAPTGGHMNNPIGNFNLMAESYGKMLDATKLIAFWHHDSKDPTAIAARQDYVNAANTAGIKKANNWFGSDLKTIDAMPDGSAKKAAYAIYNSFYSKTSNNSYWTAMNTFKSCMASQMGMKNANDVKIKPFISSADETRRALTEKYKTANIAKWSDEDRIALEQADKRYKSAYYTVPLPNGQEFKFDLNAIISNDAGWHDPSAPDNYQTYQSYVKQQNAQLKANKK